MNSATSVSAQGHSVGLTCPNVATKIHNAYMLQPRLYNASLIGPSCLISSLWWSWSGGQKPTLAKVSAVKQAKLKAKPEVLQIATCNWMPVEKDQEHQPIWNYPASGERVSVCVHGSTETQVLEYGKLLVHGHGQPTATLCQLCQHAGMCSKVKLDEIWRETNCHPRTFVNTATEQRPWFSFMSHDLD